MNEKQRQEIERRYASAHPLDSIETTPIERHLRQLCEAVPFRSFMIVLSGNDRYIALRKDEVGFTEFGALWLKVGTRTYVLNTSQISAIVLDD